MITVIDTNILLDILSGMQPRALIAQQAVRVAGLQGDLLLPVVCYAELAGYFSYQKDLDSFLKSIPISLLQLDTAASFLAGTYHRQYRKRGGPRTRVLADFMVVAQTQIHGDRLLTADHRFFGTSFPKLVSVRPEDLLA